MDELATSLPTKLSALHTFSRDIFPLLVNFQLPSCWILIELVEASISVVFQVALGRHWWGKFAVSGSCCLSRSPWGRCTLCELRVTVLSPRELQVLSINHTTQIVPLPHHRIDSSLLHLLQANTCSNNQFVLHLLGFPADPQFSHWSQNVLTIHPYCLAIFLPIASRIILFLTAQYNWNGAIWEKIITSNASKCLANFFPTLHSLHCFCQPLHIFFPFVWLYGIYILDMRSIRMSGSSANVLAMSTENNLLKYFPNILRLVFYWNTTHKKIRKNWKQSIRKMK